jgi:hypothetical protein
MMILYLLNLDMLGETEAATATNFPNPFAATVAPQTDPFAATVGYRQATS